MIYVLLLKERKYYVGYTREDDNKRIDEHFNGVGSQWTQKYKAVMLWETRKGELKDEDKVTLEYMKRYGWQNVRGGKWCNTKMKKPPKELMEMVEKELNESIIKSFEDSEKSSQTSSLIECSLVINSKLGSKISEVTGNEIASTVIVRRSIPKKFSTAPNLLNLPGHAIFDIFGSDEDVNMLLPLIKMFHCDPNCNEFHNVYYVSDVEFDVFTQNGLIKKEASKALGELILTYWGEFQMIYERYGCNKQIEKNMDKYDAYLHDNKYLEETKGEILMMFKDMRDIHNETKQLINQRSKKKRYSNLTEEGFINSKIRYKKVSKRNDESSDPEDSNLVIRKKTDKGSTSKNISNSRSDASSEDIKTKQRKNKIKSSSASEDNNKKNPKIKKSPKKKINLESESNNNKKSLKKGKQTSSASEESNKKASKKRNNSSSNSDKHNKKSSKKNSKKSSSESVDDSEPPKRKNKKSSSSEPTPKRISAKKKK